jgi:hypothetical protein
MVGMSWGHDLQRFYCGEESFVHEGPINTNPSHDCAHILIAANGGMPWNPGSNEKKFAEYNASVLEHLLDETFRSGTGVARKCFILPKALRYAHWFVEEHYRPFPVSTKEALTKFCTQLDKETIVRLAPYFFWVKRIESQNPNRFKNEAMVLTFERSDCPAFDEEIGAIQSLLREQIALLVAV